jgi:hypothetical protein
MRKYFIVVIIAGIIITGACKKSQDIIKDDTSPTGVGSYPVSTNTLQDVTVNPNITLGTVALKGGYTLKAELQYFSSDPVKEVNLYTTVGTGTRTKVLTIPYASAYSTIKKLDTLLVPYSVPTGLTAGTAIKLEYEILNQNTLNLLRPVTIKTQ